jgi:hypothetical protein
MSVLSARSLWRRTRDGLLRAYGDLWTERGLAFASPAFGFPVAYLLAYGAGAILYAGEIGQQGPVFALAIGAGFVSYLLGMAVAWQTHEDNAPPHPGQMDHALRMLAFGLVALGIGAMVAYLISIGGIPLLMPSVEQARVAAAERGGAALRVTSLLALPGVWLLAGQAGLGRRMRPAVGVVVLTGFVAAIQLLTANRAPAFTLVQVTVVTYLLGAGFARLRIAGVALLAGLVVVLVAAAGSIGAFRLSGTPATWSDPQIARAVASGDMVPLVSKAVGNYLVVPIQNFSSTMEAVPSHIGWRLGFTYVQPLITILPGRQTTFDQDLKAALAQDYAGGGTVPSMLGESYANFGPAGWVLVPILVGVFLALLYGVARRRQTPAAWTLYAYALVHMANATISGIIVANIFPYIAYAVLGAAAFGEPAAQAVRQRWRRSA